LRALKPRHSGWVVEHGAGIIGERARSGEDRTSPSAQFSRTSDARGDGIAEAASEPIAAMILVQTRRRIAISPSDDSQAHFCHYWDHDFFTARDIYARRR